MQDELTQIRYSIKSIMAKAVDGDRSAIDQVLKLSRRREELLLSRRKLGDFRRSEVKGQTGIPYRYIALGYIIGLSMSLIILLIN